MRNGRPLTRFLVLFAVFALVAPATKSGKGEKQAGDKQKQSRKAQSKAVVTVGVGVFLGRDQRLIREYVAELPSDGLPPGLAKRGGALPPGLEKQLRKNGRLPPGLQKRLHAFPATSERRLAPLAPGLKRGFIEGRAIIYREKTSVVLDIFIPF